MRTFYYFTTRNFGDRLNAWLWPRLIPELLERSDEDVLVGIGSLIKSDLAKVPGRKFIFGTGSGYGPMPDAEEVSRWRVHCVRGPLTAQLSGLPAESAVVDAAWLVDLLPEYRHVERPRDGVVFVPHWTTDLYANWRQPCAEAGYNYVSPHLDGHQVLASIAGARLAIVESLHGAILADYYRTPWIPVASAGRVLGFKWLDFCLSLGLPLRQLKLPSTDRADSYLSGSDEQAEAIALEYYPQLDAEQFANIPHGKSAPATWHYRIKNTVKGVARPVRSSLFDGLQTLRGSRYWRQAFHSRSRELAALLEAIAREPAYLSPETTRRGKLDQLASRLDDLRGNFDLPAFGQAGNERRFETTAA